MPINVFGNSSNNSDNKIDTSLFVQKPYLRTNYIESNIEDFDLKNQYRIKNLPDPLSTREACSKNYVDNLFNDPSIVKNTEIDQSSLVRNNQDNDFGNYNLTNMNSITLNKQAENDNEVITKAYVDQFHQENERSRRDLGIDFYNESDEIVKNNQDNDLNDKKLTNLVRYPKDGVLINFEENSYLDQYRDLKLFYKDYVGEELLQPYITYPDMKYLYPIQITDLRFQVDHITPKKIQLFEEFSEDPANERLFIILVRHRQVEMISDGNKIIEVKVI